MRVLLNEYKDKRVTKIITEVVLITVVENVDEGPEVFRMLLLEEGVVEKVNKEILKYAGHGKNRDIIEDIYSRHRSYNEGVMDWPSRIQWDIERNK